MCHCQQQQGYCCQQVTANSSRVAVASRSLPTAAGLLLPAGHCQQQQGYCCQQVKRRTVFAFTSHGILREYSVAPWCLWMRAVDNSETSQTNNPATNLSGLTAVLWQSRYLRWTYEVNTPAEEINHPQDMDPLKADGTKLTKEIRSRFKRWPSVQPIHIVYVAERLDHLAVWKIL